MIQIYNKYLDLCIEVSQVTNIQFLKRLILAYSLFNMISPVFIGLSCL